MRARVLCAWLAGVGLIAPVQAQSGHGCQNDQAKVELNRGVGAFKEAEYAKAVDHFRAAVELDAGCTLARLYLATAYMQQYIPGAEAPENKAMAAAAKEQFDKVLEQEPDNELAMASLASRSNSTKFWNRSRTTSWRWLRWRRFVSIRKSWTKPPPGTRSSSR
ncbi:MAG: hypothetical protein ABSG56_07045 [Bryobacteraceae bacterium]